MSDRTIELYTKAAEFACNICKDEGREGGPSDHIWNTLVTGKFAELIVEECITKCQSNVIGMVGTHASAHNSAIQKCINSIKEHFGVEE